MMQRPAHALLAALLVALGCCALMAAVIAHRPGVSAAFGAAVDGRITLDGARPVAPAADVLFTHGTTRVTLVADELRATYEPDGDSRFLRDHHRRRMALAAMLGRGDASLTWPDGSQHAVRAVPRDFKDLPAALWIGIATGFIAAAIGGAVGVLQAGQPAARWFAASGVGMAGGALSTVLSEYLTPASAPAWSFWSIEANRASTYLFGVGLLGTFAAYPRRLVGDRSLFALGAVLALLCLAGLVAPWPGLPLLAPLAVPAFGLAIVGLIVWQRVASRGDPVSRAALGWVGLCFLASVAIYIALAVIPLLSATPLAIPGSALVAVFLLMYLGFAVAIGRYRLFDLGRWTAAVVRSAAVLAAILILDIAITVWSGARWSLTVAVLAAAAAWLPLRAWLVASADRRRHELDQSLIAAAGRVAFTRSDDERAARWRALLETAFRPLEIETATGDRVAIFEDGRALVVPSPVGGPTLRLRFAGAGAQVFGSRERALAEASLAMVAELVAAQRAYDSGVEAERTRIARDLHDDVGARLMTVLHRDNLPTAQADVREAITEIRGIVDGLTAAERPLGEVLADIRYETIQRFAPLSIALEWPVTAALADERRLPALHHRNIVSVMRELVSNTIRHAGASTVTITLDTTLDALRITVADDGCGLPAIAGAHGNGLRNARRRLNEIGGALLIDAGDRGAVIQLVLPLAPSLELGMAAAGTVD